MKRFINKAAFGLILIVLILIQFSIKYQNNDFPLKRQVNNLPVLFNQLSAQENILATNITLENEQYPPVLLDPKTYHEVDLLLDVQTNLTLNTQKDKLLVNNQEINLITQKNNLITATKETIPLGIPVPYNQENTLVVAQVDNLSSQENNPVLLDSLILENKAFSEWAFEGKVIVDWDIESSHFSSNEGSEVASETSSDTFYLTVDYGKKEFVGFNLEFYPTQNLKLRSFVTFNLKNLKFNTGFNYDSRATANKATGYFQVFSGEGFFGKIFKQKGLKTTPQGGENLFIETEKQKESIREKGNTIITSLEKSVLNNNHFDGLEVGFARENMKLAIVLELGSGINSAFGGKKYSDSISLIDFYNAAIDNNKIFTNSIYFGTTTTSMDAAYQKINTILSFVESSNIIAVASADNYAIASFISAAQPFVTTAAAAQTTASSRPTTTSTADIDIYHETVLRFYRSEENYDLLNNISLNVLGVDIDRYQSHGFNSRNDLDTDVINVIDNFLESRTLLADSINSMVPKIEPFSSNTVSGNVALQFDHQWKKLFYGLIITKGSYSGTNWFGETAVIGGGFQFSLGKKFNFFMNSFNSNLKTNYTDKYAYESSIRNINIQTENLDYNLDFGIDI